jgi:hypothetical protein
VVKELVNQLCEVRDFIRGIRIRARFGERSRAPLRLLRLQLRGDAAECEWVARAADAWDADIPGSLRERNVSGQALADALTVRELLFRALPGVRSAVFRVYRPSQCERPDLIIAGTVSRDEPMARNVTSLAMRAKLSGLRFELADGNLEALQLEE